MAGLVAVAVVAGILIAGSGGREAEAAPAFTLPEAGGGQVALSDYRGKPVVIVFFRTFT